LPVVIVVPAVVASPQVVVPHPPVRIVVVPVRTIPDDVVRISMRTYIHAGRKLPLAAAHHIGEYKVRCNVYLKDFGLDPAAEKRLIYMVGARYNKSKREVLLTCDRFFNRVENRRYLYFLLESLKTAAMDPDPELDRFYPKENGQIGHLPAGPGFDALAFEAASAAFDGAAPAAPAAAPARVGHDYAALNAALASEADAHEAWALAADEEEDDDAAAGDAGDVAAADGDAGDAAAGDEAREDEDEVFAEHSEEVLAEHADDVFVEHSEEASDAASAQDNTAVPDEAAADDATVAHGAGATDEAEAQPAEAQPDGDAAAELPESPEGASEGEAAAEERP